MSVRMAQSPFQGREEEQSATLERWAGGWTLEFFAGERARDGGHKVQQLAGFLLDFCAEIIILNNTSALRVCIFRSVT